VWGLSGGGTGVHGQSGTGRGGVFESERIAQVRLVPTVIPALPALGELGDLFLLVSTDPTTGETAPTLYLCVSPGDGTPGNAAQWAPVQLGPAEVGG